LGWRGGRILVLLLGILEKAGGWTWFLDGENVVNSW
jgi:hypothetical protein